MTNKIHYILSLISAGLLLISCHQEVVEPTAPDTRPLVFGTYMGSYANDRNPGTRAGETRPLSDFVNDFVVYGINGNLEVDDTTFEKKDVVFDNYVVWHQANSAGTTETNTDDWEYVGSYTTGGGRSTETQRVKYWDNKQNCHYFWALSDADKGTFTSANLGSDGRVANYTLELHKENLSETMALYYSEITQVTTLDYGKVVPLRFKPYLSKIRIGFYETIPGYVVSNLQVRQADDSYTDDILLSSMFVEEGTCHLTYQYGRYARITTSIDPSSSESSLLNVGPVQYTALTARTEGEEDNLPNSFVTGSNYLARSSDAPSYTLGGGKDMNYFTYVLPFENRTTPITLTCDYTLTNTVTGVTSTISDATVTVPYEYAQMQPGYEYTYLFKITDGGKTVQLDDVKVEPWHYGGSQTENPWKNW